MTKPKGVKRFYDKKLGRWWNYHRASGQRIKAEFGTIQFLIELDKIETAWKAKQPVQGTVGNLIDAYEKSPEFTRLKQRTREDYKKVFDYMQGLRALPLAKFTGPFITVLRNQTYEKRKRRFTNYLLQVISRMYKVGIGLDIVKPPNPVEYVGKIRKRTDEAHLNRPWTIDEREIVLAKATTSLRGPLAVMRYLGARLGDTRTMRKDAYQDGRITFRTGKGNVLVTVPCPAPLAQILDNLPANETEYLFVSNKGNAWTEGGFHASLRKFLAPLVADGRIGSGLTPHGLRHSVATDLRELGYDDRRIADILGQKTTYAVPTYTAQANMTKSNERVMRHLYGEDK